MHGVLQSMKWLAEAMGLRGMLVLTGVFLATALPVHATAAASTSTSTSTRDDDRTLRVIAFNIRYDTPRDEENAWRFRRDRVVGHLAESDADFIGFQEALPSQRAELAAGLLDYGSIGRSRDRSPTEGEATPIFFLRARWTVVPNRSGTFWLSETPNTPGSSSWKSSCPRIATWGVFQQRDTGRRVMVVNTHLDHVSQEARQEGARTIAKFLSVEAIDLPVIVMGDFNAGPANPARRILCEGVAGSPPLVDTYTDRFAESERDAGTFHGFRGGAAGPRIDAILVSEDFEITAATIDRTMVDGVHLSDHYPVTAILQWRMSTADAVAPAMRPETTPISPTQTAPATPTSPTTPKQASPPNTTPNAPSPSTPESPAPPPPAPWPVDEPDREPGAR